MTDYISYFQKDQFARHTGIELLECSPGKAKCMLEIKDYHLNGAGLVHGGVLYTLADFCCAAASNAYGKVALSIENHISYFQKCDNSKIYATATINSKSNKLITCTVTLVDDKGVLLSTFMGTSYVTKQEIDFKTENK